MAPTDLPAPVHLWGSLLAASVRSGIRFIASTIPYRSSWSGMAVRLPCAYLRVGSSGRRFCDDKKRTIIERSSCERDGRQPDHLDLKKGEQVRFVIENKGLLKHEFMLASAKDNDKHAEMMRKFPDMEHDDPNASGVTMESLKRLRNPKSAITPVISTI